MRGIKSLHLELLISYIYQGEVQVSTNDFKDFLAVASEFKVKGLTKDDTSDTLLEKQIDRNRNKNQQEHHGLSEKPFTYKSNETDEIQHAESAILVKQENHSDLSDTQETQDILTHEDSKTNVLKKIETTYSCDLCGKLSETMVGLKAHKYRYHSVKKTEDLNTTAIFECNVCEKKSI